MQVGGSADLRTWILPFGAGAEVLEPDAVREELRGALERHAKSSGAQGHSQRSRARFGRSSSP